MTPAGVESESVDTAADGASAKPAGKGRPTPKRRDAEAANRRPLVVDKKSLSAEEKERRRAERVKARELMLAGDERYLSPRDKGPERKWMRDQVDRRWNIGEVLLPIMLAVLMLSLLPFQWSGTGMILAAYGLMVFGVVDCWLLWRRVKSQHIEKFGTEPARGSAWYVVLRAFQMRGGRMPRPAVQRGGEPIPLSERVRRPIGGRKASRPS